MRKETKIGLFALITLALAIWGFQYLKGFNILSPKNTVKVVYERVDGLRISTPVLLNGLQVGLVADIRQDKEDLHQILVTLELDKDIRIPKTARANIITTSLMGGNAIELEFEGSCSGADCVQDGDVIEGKALSMLASMADPAEVDQYVKQISAGLTSVIDTLNSRLKDSREIQESVQDVRSILANLNNTTGQLDRMMTGSVKNSVENIEALTSTLRNSNEQIKTILDNAAGLTTDLNNANLDEVASDAKEVMAQLKTTLQSSQNAVNQLEGMLAKVKNGEGAVGMLLNDEKFAKEVQLTVKHLELLLQDVRLHPERYRRILSKKKDPYTKPVEDPGIGN
jgi:phospholipid/cholesterol/gamma-HCH transport system substrate-binding protein